MKAYYIDSPKGISSIQMRDCSRPEVGANEVRVSMQAWSLNYRDLAMPAGGYLNNSKVVDNPPLIPLSDGAGEVIAVGENVRRVTIGDRVVNSFFANWLDGPISAKAIASGYGGAVDGVLAEEIVFNEESLVRIPDYISYEEAACMPCAATTAWEALQLAKTRIGSSVLTLGTGGVSLFALQLAKAAGAQVYITSSSDEKLERAKKLGADYLINYKTHPDWEKEVLRLTSGRGVDHVIELGGAGTLERSLQAVAVGGHVSLIGVLTGETEEQPSPMPILFKRLCVQGIYVGPRSRLEEVLQFASTHAIHPVIDDTRFSFDQVQEAYRYLKSGAHFGKVVITR